MRGRRRLGSRSSPRTEGGAAIGRRRFLGAALAAAAAPLAGSLAVPTSFGAEAPARPARRTASPSRAGGSPFTLGVASGYPLPTSVVLWTRLAPAPLIPGGGMSPDVVMVDWEVASDDRMGQIVRRGTAAATAAWEHSVHVEVDELEPGRWYWYRF